MAAVEQTMTKVQRLLTQAMDLRVSLSDGSYWVDFTDASTSVRITVRDWIKDRDGEPQTVVLVESLALRGARPTPALYEWVAREGGSRWFGHVEVRDDEAEPGTVCLMVSHALLGDYLDEKELAAAMWGVLFAADSWDDELKQRFGGRRAKDRAR